MYSFLLLTIINSSNLSINESADKFDQDINIRNKFDNLEIEKKEFLDTNKLMSDSKINIHEPITKEKNNLLYSDSDLNNLQLADKNIDLKVDDLKNSLKLDLDKLDKDVSNFFTDEVDTAKVKLEKTLSKVSLSESLIEFANNLGENNNEESDDKTKYNAVDENNVNKRRNGVIITDKNLLPCNQIASAEKSENIINKKQNFEQEKSSVASSTDKSEKHEKKQNSNFIRKLRKSFRKKLQITNKN